MAGEPPPSAVGGLHDRRPVRSLYEENAPDSSCRVEEAAFGPKAAEVPASQKSNAAKWEKWSQKQRFTGTPGHDAVPDVDNPQLMNRWTWYQTHHWASPYPGDPTIYGPDNVPGVPAGSKGDG